MEQIWRRCLFDPHSRCWHLHSTVASHRPQSCRWLPSACSTRMASSCITAIRHNRRHRFCNSCLVPSRSACSVIRCRVHPETWVNHILESFLWKFQEGILKPRKQNRKLNCWKHLKSFTMSSALFLPKACSKLFRSSTSNPLDLRTVIVPSLVLHLQQNLLCASSLTFLPSLCHS